MLEWRSVVGFEGIYLVSNQGHLLTQSHLTQDKRGRFRKIKSRLRKPAKNRDGYLTCLLCNGAKIRSTSMHRLVAEAFIPNPHNLPEVEHRDRNRANNWVHNLEWISKLDNDAKGERVCGSKLTAADVKRIRELLKEGFRQRQIAAMFDVDISAISSIKIGRNWKHI
jgi:NUMOD4 motif/HNH endonuclease